MITVNRKELVDSLRRAYRLTPRNPSLPALKNIKLTIDSDTIMLHSTNLDQTLLEIIPVRGKTSSTVNCVPAMQLLDVLRALPQHMQEVPMEAKPGCLVVGTTKLQPGCATNDFPSLPKCPENAQAIIELPNEFQSNLRFVRTAVSREVVRYALTGILFDFEQGNVVSSDGKRLHCAHLWDPSPIPSVILPPAAFDVDVPNQIVIPHPGRGGNVGEAFFITQNGYLATKTVEGTFPAYSSLVPKERTSTAIVDRRALLGVVDQVLAMMGDKSPACMFHLNKHFQIHAKDPDSGAEHTNDVDAWLSGREIRMSFNPHLLRELLRTISADRVTLGFTASRDAAYITTETGAQWALLMPLTKDAAAQTQKKPEKKERSA